MPRACLWALVLAALAIGLWLRVGDLSMRPMHTDEAVHAEKFRRLWLEGAYKYDPEEYHGPTLYYATLPIVWLTGIRDFESTAEWMYRSVPLIFTLGLIALLPLVADGLGRRATVGAALLTAVSPAFVYYGRYYIQEPLFVFFTFAAIACGWRYLRSRRAIWAILAGVAVGLVHATKETAIIQLGCIDAALVLTSRQCITSESRGAKREGGDSVDGLIALRSPLRTFALALLGLCAAVAISVAFYSNMFTDRDGPADSIRTYLTYFDRAGNHGLHNHPWYFYFNRLLFIRWWPGPAWSEAVIVIAALLGIAAAIRADRTARQVSFGAASGESSAADTPHTGFIAFLTLYTVMLTLAYTLISYKTTWCMLGFLHGMILLAGVGIAAILRACRDRDERAAVVLVGLLAGGNLAWQANRANSAKFCASNYNPYVYAHPVNDLLNLPSWLEKLAAIDPAGHELLIRVYTPDAWPVPWYLRRFRNVGYWDEVGENADAPVVVAWPSMVEDFERARRDEYQSSLIGLRPGVVLHVYTRRSLYDAFVAAQARGATPTAGRRESAP